MAYDVEQGHGEIEELSIAPPDKALRPLTVDEKLAALKIDVEECQSQGSQVIEYNNVPAVQDDRLLSRLRNLEAALDRKLGVESQAIERKRPEDRTPVPCSGQRG